MASGYKRRYELILSVVLCTAMVVRPVPIRAGDAEQFGSCTSDRETPSTNLAPFGDDNGFDIVVNQDASGANIRVTGDLVVLDKSTIGSLIANPSTPLTKINTLTIDGRIVILKDPISLEGGSINIFADRLAVEQRGFISLYPSAAMDSRVLRIVARSLDVSKARKRFLDFGLRGNKNASFVGAVQDSSLIRSAEQLWSRTVDSIDSPSIIAADGFQIGPSSAPAVESAFKSEMEWPLHSAAKLRKHFARSPFSSATYAEIRAIAQQLEKRFAEWRDPLPFVIVNGISTAISSQTDLDGMKVAYTPKESFAFQQKRLEKEVGSDAFARLARIAALGQGDGNRLNEQLTETKRQRSQVAADVSTVEREIAEGSALLASRRQAGLLVDQRIAVRIKDLEAARARDEEKLKQSQRIRQWATVTASAVAIGLTAGGATPVVAAGATAGVAVTGDLVYRHNADQAMTLGDALELGTATYQRAQEFQESWTNYQRQRETASQVYAGEQVLEGAKPDNGADTRVPVTKTQATVRLVLAAGEAAKKAHDIGGGAVAESRLMSLDEYQDNDGDMRSLLAERTEVANDLATLAAKLDGKTAELQAMLAKDSELRSIDEALRAANPRNDQELARWRANAYVLWGMEVERISGLLSRFRKSLYFESGRLPTGVADVMDYPAELESKSVAGILAPNGGAQSTAGPEDVLRRLNEQSERFVQAASTSAKTITNAFDQYRASRAQATVNRISRKFSSASNSASERAFIQSLNAQVRQQIVTHISADKVAAAYVPWKLAPSLSRTPERLVTAAIVSVEFDVPTSRIGSDALQFAVIHPQYGEMKQGPKCYLADLRSTPDDWAVFPTSLESVDKNWNRGEKSIVQIAAIDPDNFYTRLPARAPYSLVVVVSSQQWKSIPTIKSIEIGLEVMQ